MSSNPYSVTNQNQGQPAQPVQQVASTTIQHPKLPSNASFIERIALSGTFAIVNTLVRDEHKKEELAEYMIPLRDALNEAYPEE